MKKLIAVATTAGLLIVGTAGIAQAAETPNPTAKTHLAQGRGHRLQAAGKVAAATIGIEPKVLAAAVRGGKSVADVARDHDVDPQDVIDAVVAAANKKVDEAVDAGTITDARAATLKEKMPTRVAKLVNGELKGKRHDRAALRRQARRGAVVIAADTIGITPRELISAVRGGQSVADVAASHDVEAQAVIDAVVAAGNKRIDQAVDGGKLTAERAARLKERLSERVTRRVNATPRERAAARP